MTTDPTIESLRKFEDPSQWVVVPNVPFMVPHERSNADGTTKYKVGPQRLQAIAATMDAIEAEDGVLPKIQVGHTKKDGPEPEILGFVRNRRIGEWGPKGKVGLLGDYWFMKDQYPKAKGLPFRSGEFYPARNQVSAVALLARDPELDMGMVFYDRVDDCEYYSMPDTKPADQQHTPESTPAPKIESDVDTMIRLAREEQAVELKRQSDQIERLEKALAAEQYARSATVSENAVKQLQLEGYVVKNPANLVKKLAGLTDEQRTAELAEIRENYSRAPLEQPLIRTADVPDNSKQCSREDYDRAVSYATANKCTFDEALSKIKAK